MGWTIGDQIGSRFAVYRVLGGGMGVVYVVFDHHDQCGYAIKTVRDDILERSPRLAERFHREATAWISLDQHPNIVQAWGFANLDGKPSLILEYVSGGDLSSAVKSGALQLDIPKVIRFGIQIADGMVHAAQKGIRAHRDLKPQNCLLSPTGSVKVSDFGLAALFEEASEVIEGQSEMAETFSDPESITQTGAALGTPAYMAPEQFIDAKRADVRADVYALGAMLYEMLTGRTPFKANSWEGYWKAHASSEWRPLDGSSRLLAPVVTRCLAKRPDERFQDFHELRTELASILRATTGEIFEQPSRRMTLHPLERFNKGRSLLALGLVEKAWETFDELLQHEPDNVDAWVALAECLELLGKNHDAEAARARARRLSVGPMPGGGRDLHEPAPATDRRISVAPSPAPRDPLTLEMRPRYIADQCRFGFILFRMDDADRAKVKETLPALEHRAEIAAGHAIRAGVTAGREVGMRMGGEFAAWIGGANGFPSPAGWAAAAVAAHDLIAKDVYKDALAPFDGVMPPGFLEMPDLELALVGDYGPQQSELFRFIHLLSNFAPKDWAPIRELWDSPRRNPIIAANNGLMEVAKEARRVLAVSIAIDAVVQCTIFEAMRLGWMHNHGQATAGTSTTVDFSAVVSALLSTDAAISAAVAVVVQDLISPSRFQTIYAPFATSIPLQ